MPKAIQLDLFTGEPIPLCTADTEKQERIRKTTRLALQVQLSMARLDKLTDTMKFVSELCSEITGVAYPVDIDERRRTHQQQRQQASKRAIAAEIQMPQRKTQHSETLKSVGGIFMAKRVKQI